MRSEADLRAAAARAGGIEVVQVERVPIAPGKTVLAAKLAFADPWAAARLLVELAQEDAADPTVRAWALQILTATARAIGEPLGPTLSPALRDAVAEAIHANVQAQIKFVHEPEETFQGADVTIELGAGDCDDHARLVYALAEALGIPAELTFFETEEGMIALPTILLQSAAESVPVHVVARLQTSDGAWQWAETTIDAAFGEDPFDALARLGPLEAAGDPFSHAAADSGAPLGFLGLDFVTPGDVQNRKTQLDSIVNTIDADAVRCAALDSATLSAWNEFVVAWREFYAVAPSVWNAGGQGRQAQDYAEQIRDWQARLGAICTLTGAKLPESKPDSVLGAVTTIAVAAGVVAAAWTIRPLLARL